MMACGISPYRLLRPVLVLACVCWAATSWVMFEAMPDANQTLPRDHACRSSTDRAEGEVRAARVLRRLPQHRPLRPRDPAPAAAGRTCWPPTPRTPRSRSSTSPGAAGWSSTARRRPSRWCSRTARGTRTKLDDPARLRGRRASSRRSSRSIPRACSRAPGPARGEREMTDRRAAQSAIVELERQELSAHNPVMEIHKKFSIPVACFVFARARPRARRQQPQGRQAGQLRARHRRSSSSTT